MIFFDFVSQRDPTLLVLTLFLFAAMGVSVYIDSLFKEDEQDSEDAS